MVKVYSAIFMVLIACGCNRVDFKGFFMTPSDGVQARFEQSSKMNQDLKEAVVETQEDYVFYVATDPHIDKTAINLTKFNDAFRNDREAVFGLILGDCIDVKDNLPSYLGALACYPEKHSFNQHLFHVLGNHDIFFNGWKNYKELIGPSVYWFEVVFPQGKDIYISLDTANGTLGGKQTEWLKAFLEKNRNSYRHCVIFTHTNFFYTDNSQVSSGNMPLEETYSLIDFFGKQKVSLVLQGHDHYREEVLYDNVRYTIVGTISDKSDAPEYLTVRMTPEDIKMSWHYISK